MNTVPAIFASTALKSVNDAVNIVNWSQRSPTELSVNQYHMLRETVPLYGRIQQHITIRAEDLLHVGQPDPLMTGLCAEALLPETVQR